MINRKLVKYYLSLSILLILSVNRTLALIPEPSNIIYGSITIDGEPLTAVNNHVSLVLYSGEQKITSYTMGDIPTMGDKYKLEAILDSISTRSVDTSRTGDELVIRYQVAGESLAVANVFIGERGEAIELNLTLRSEFIDAGLDPSIFDSDGDGIPDDIEIAAGLDPELASDALLDADGDGISNLQEYANGTNILVDDYGPSLTLPSNKVFNATGLFTKVDLGNAVAFDSKDGDLTATDDSKKFYKPGSYRVIWTASDAAGNTTIDSQLISVIPMISFAADQLVAEGGVVSLTAVLNGMAREYPVIVPYTVSGTASPEGIDFTLVDGEIIINSGLSANIEFPIAADAIDAEGVETIIVTMGSPVNAVVGSRDVFVAQIIEDNVAPSVSIIANQGNGQTSTIISSEGSVKITIVVNDPNLNDVHTYDWSLTDSLLIDIDNNGTDNSFIFDPSELTEGTYKVSLTVTDSSAAAGNVDLFLRIVDAAPILAFVDTDGDGINDNIEGFIDLDGDGIPDYLDSIAQTNVIQEISIVADQYLIETETGLHLSLGEVSINTGGVAVDIIDIESAFNVSSDITTDLNSRSGGIFDFSIAGLTDDGDLVLMVIPQLEAIAESSVYSQFVSSNKGWINFVEDSNNVLFSAAGAAGYCPSPGSSLYTLGLTAGDWCVQLLIEDGGPNDAESIVNKTIKHLGAVAKLNGSTVNNPATNTTNNTASNASSGGGVWSLLLLLIFSLINRHCWCYK